MSVLYLGTDLESLASELALVLDGAVHDDCFRTVTVVVPNRNVRKWLQLYLSRRDGVTINIQFDYLEHVLWKLLCELDPREHPAPLIRLEEDHYRLLTLAPLLEEDADSFTEPLRKYLGPDRERRNWWRRAWNLADHLAGLIRDYEYHRQDGIIRKWLAGEDAFPHASPHELAMERAQRELFRRITRVDRPEQGLRWRLGQLLEPPKICKTLPQYAAELRHEVKEADLRRPAAPPMVPLFGVTQLSAFHINVLHWLGQYVDIRLFHQNPLVGRLGGSSDTAAPWSVGPLPKVGDDQVPPHSLRARRRRDEDGHLPLFPEAPAREDRPVAAAPLSRQVLEEVTAQFRRPDFGARQELAPGVGNELLAAWASAGSESLRLAASLLEEPSPFEVELVRRRSPATMTVLSRLQDHLLGSLESELPRLDQDISLQIVACQGIYREVETVHASIVANLHRDPDLKQTDVAVLLTDVARYRPAIQAVFSRAPEPLSCNLSDFSAAELSVFGHALYRMLDLAMESFTRSRSLRSGAKPLLPG